MHLLPAVDIGLRKSDFHYLRTQRLQMIIKDVHQEVMHLGTSQTIINHEVECFLDIKQDVIIVRVIKVFQTFFFI